MVTKTEQDIEISRLGKVLYVFVHQTSISLTKSSSAPDLEEDAAVSARIHNWIVVSG